MTTWISPCGIIKFTLFCFLKREPAILQIFKNHVWNQGDVVSTVRWCQPQEIPGQRGQLALQTSLQSPWRYPSGSSAWTTCSGSHDPQQTVKKHTKKTFFWGGGGVMKRAVQLETAASGLKWWHLTHHRCTQCGVNSARSSNSCCNDHTAQREKERKGEDGQSRLPGKIIECEMATTDSARSHKHTGWDEHLRNCSRGSKGR